MTGLTAFKDGDFPGYAEAVAHENIVRGAACLGLSLTLGGVPVRPLTAAHVRLLTLASSPFLLTHLTAEQLMTKPNLVDDLVTFLWIVSPWYQPGVTARRHWWQRRTARDHFNAAAADLPAQPAAAVVQSVIDYITEAYLDAEEAPATVSDKAYFAFEISIADELRDYGFRMDFWNQIPVEKNPLHVPLQIVFQLRKLRKLKAGQIVSNRSEKFIAEGLANLKRN
jgi:hypothetical protein